MKILLVLMVASAVLGIFSSAHAQSRNTLDGFVEDVGQSIRNHDFEMMNALLDPDEELPDKMETIANFLEQYFPVGTSKIYEVSRVQTTASGARLVLAIAGDEGQMFFGMALLKRDDGWFLYDFNFSDDFEKIVPYQ